MVFPGPGRVKLISGVASPQLVSLPGPSGRVKFAALTNVLPLTGYIAWIDVLADAGAAPEATVQTMAPVTAAVAASRVPGDLTSLSCEPLRARRGVYT